MAVTSKAPSLRPNVWLGAPLTVIYSVMAVCLPVSRTVFGTDISLQVAVLAAMGLVLSALGYVARPPHAWLWISGAAMIPAAGLVSGVNSSVSSSLLVGLLSAAMIVTQVSVITRLVRERPQAVKHIVGWFIVGQTVSAAAGVLQLLGFRIADGLIFGRATGLAEHPNTLGLMAIIVILIGLGVWKGAHGLLRIALLGVITLNGAVLVGTGSLSAMLALAAGLFIGIIAARKVIGTAVTGILVLALAGSAVALSNVEQTFLDSIIYRITVVTGQSSGGGGAASLEVRELTYAWAWDWIDKSPILGVGLDPRNAGTFDGVTVVHNYLLRGWYQGGIIYVTWLVLLTLTVTFGIVIAALRRRSNPWAASIVFGILVFAFTAAFLNQPQYWMPFLLAFVLASRRTSPATDGPPPQSAPQSKRPSQKPLAATGATNSV